jgi:hypothetical protein
MECVQLSSVNGDPPYLIAVGRAPDSGSRDDISRWRYTHTNTNARMISLPGMERIVMHFFKNGDRNQDVEWEEV